MLGTFGPNCTRYWVWEKEWAWLLGRLDQVMKWKKGPEKYIRKIDLEPFFEGLKVDFRLFFLASLRLLHGVICYSDFFFLHVAMIEIHNPVLPFTRHTVYVVRFVNVAFFVVVCWALNLQHNIYDYLSYSICVPYVPYTTVGCLEAHRSIHLCAHLRLTCAAERPGARDVPLSHIIWHTHTGTGTHPSLQSSMHRGYRLYKLRRACERAAVNSRPYRSHRTMRAPVHTPAAWTRFGRTHSTYGSLCTRALTAAAASAAVHTKRNHRNIIALRCVRACRRTLHDEHHARARYVAICVSECGRVKYV